MQFSVPDYSIRSVYPKGMKRFLVTLVLLGSTFFSSQSGASADVNDFTFESFDATYELSVNKDAANRPEMIVTEKLVAVFPEIDQNRGIRRLIPASSYGDLPGLIKIISVTDENAEPREYETTYENGFVILAIKKSDDSYVHGRQTYVIKYKQSWVIDNFQSSSGFDEFYWDINGTGWPQSFGKVTATVSFDETLRRNLVLDHISCYQGPSGSTSGCDAKDVSEDKMVFTANNLAGGENLSVAIAFNPGVVNTSGPDVSGTTFWYLFWVAMFLVLAILLWAIYFRIFGIRSQGKKAFIVPQYQAAKEPGLLKSALISGKSSHLIQALVVEAAVNKELEIQQVADREKNFILRRTKASQDSALFGALGLAKAGDELLIGPDAKAKTTTALAKAIAEFTTTAKKEVSKEGYFLKRALGIPALVFVFAIAVFVAWTISAAMLDAETDAGYLAAPLISFGIFALIYWLLLSKRAHSAKGSEVIAHLKGLAMYVELAEKDRLEFLQSPKGASLKPSEVKGQQVLKLYEAVLPWAILLGLQKQWNKVLTELYEQTGTPVWFIGTPVISESLSQLDSALTTSLAVSTSGGSDGGGSSGGGSGGGGGGGI